MVFISFWEFLKFKSNTKDFCCWLFKILFHIIAALCSERADHYYSDNRHCLLMTEWMPRFGNVNEIIQ